MENRIFKVEKLANGGMGIVRDGDRAIFVPFVIPGEEVKIREESRLKRDYRRATYTKLIKSSPHRRKPPCHLFGSCGGCQLQHVAYPAQLKLKREILAESLSWIAKINPEIAPMIPSPNHYNYRSRIRMHVRAGIAGFFAMEKKKFLPVKYCHIAYNAINDAISSLSALVKMEKPQTIEQIRRETIIGASRRVRPALMTSATTILALLPVLTSIGKGSDIMIPMAIPSFGGMTLSLVDLLIVPTLFCMVKEFIARRTLKKSR